MNYLSSNTLNTFNGEFAIMVMEYLSRANIISIICNPDQAKANWGHTIKLLANQIASMHNCVCASCAVARTIRMPAELCH